MTFRPLILAALATLGLPAAAQTAGPVTKADSSRSISVEGNGEVRAIPDRAVVQVGIKSTGETVDEALENHAAELARVEALLASADIPDDAWRVVKSAVTKDQDQFGNQGGDQAAISVLTMNVDDLAGVPTLLASIADADDDLLVTHERTVEVKYVVRDLEAVRLQALRLAVTDAERRAGLVADLTGMRLGVIGDVRESGAENFGRENDQEGYLGQTPNGTVRVAASVNVTFPLYEAD